MISTLTHSRATNSPPSSYVLDSVPHYSTTIEELHTESLPSVATAIKNLTARHNQELQESLEPLVPRVGNCIKRSFRDFYIREATTIFEFLEKPVAGHPTIVQAYSILKRFGKGEYTGNRNKLRDLVLDVSANSILQEIQGSLENTTGMTPFTHWTQQTRTIVEQWRQATTDYSAAEKLLQERINIFEDIYKRVQLFLKLPPGEGYESMAQSTETYLKNMFETHEIEKDYLDLIHALKKIVILTEALSTIRQMVNASTEPLCTVCFHDPVNFVCVPCGHTFCGGCGGRQITTCYICRVPVKDRVKIYFS